MKKNVFYFSSLKKKPTTPNLFFKGELTKYIAVGDKYSPLILLTAHSDGCVDKIYVKDHQEHHLNAIYKQIIRVASKGFTGERLRYSKNIDIDFISFCEKTKNEIQSSFRLNIVVYKNEYNIYNYCDYSEYDYQSPLLPSKFLLTLPSYRCLKEKFEKTITYYNKGKLHGNNKVSFIRVWFDDIIAVEMQQEKIGEEEEVFYDYAYG